MGLLDKLEQVEIKADSRLPEDDLMFCETQNRRMMNPAVRSVKYANSGKKRFRRKETCSA